ncbi:MAG: CdaR family protein [Acidobacteria bacterium]|jgi:YbbR domain-containing protein|nr:CdaR family protein [Acidobacteriota bacterium]
MKIDKIITGNLGLKIMALFLALLIWAMITGKERSYAEKTLECRVEYCNLAKNIDVCNVRPEKVQLKIKGTTKELARISSEDFKIIIDLKDIAESTRGNYFIEDYIQSPKAIQIMSAQPRMIEITTKEFVTKEVDVRIRYKGKLPHGIRLIDRKVFPEKVKISGYKSEIGTINFVEGAEYVNLVDIKESTTLKVLLMKEKEISRMDTDEVELFLEVEDLNRKKNE